MSGKAPLISVIVPVYNTEEYLRRCLDSVVNQTFKDIEVIVVNDASEGNCREIIEAYQKNDRRIRYIEHSENRSLIQARKTGNINSVGKYIMYVDSDDELEINTCEEIYKVVSQEDYDIVSFGARVISKEANKDIEWALATNRYNIQPQFLMNETIQNKISHSILNKEFCQ